jgi:hypothetical protein
MSDYPDWVEDPDEGIVSEDVVGTFLYTSWGYDQTNIDFAHVVGVTSSGKSVRVQIVEATVESRSKGQDNLAPTETPKFEETVNLRVKCDDSGIRFRGSYPFADGGKRGPESFYLFDKDSVGQTAHGYRH